jgi:hypothetical protein
MFLAIHRCPTVRSSLHRATLKSLLFDWQLIPRPENILSFRFETVIDSLLWSNNTSSTLLEPADVVQAELVQVEEHWKNQNFCFLPHLSACLHQCVRGSNALIECRGLQFRTGLLTDVIHHLLNELVAGCEGKFGLQMTWVHRLGQNNE